MSDLLAWRPWGLLRRTAALPVRDLLLLLRVTLLLLVIGIGFRLVPLRRLQRLLGRASRSAAAAGCADRLAATRLVWAVEAVGRHGVGTCLSRALALSVLLGRHGIATRLWLGVRHADAPGPARKPFLAHAWLEHDGRAILGGPAPAPYTPLGYFEAGEAWVESGGS